MFRFCTAAPEAPFAQIVQPRHKPRLLICPEDIDLQPVGVVAAFCIEPLQRVAVRERNNLHERFARIGPRQCLVDVLAFRTARQRPERQRHFHDHPLRKPADSRRKHGQVREAGELLHFRRMLVLLAEAVDAEVILRLALFKFGDHRLAAARIARHGVHAHRPAGRKDPGCHKRAHKRNEAGGIASGIGDPLGRSNRRALAPVHLGKAIHPARRNPVSGGGVDDDGVGIGNQAGGQPRGIVGQAEDHHIGLVDQARPLFDILALVGMDRDQLQILAALQPLGNLKPGRPGLAINENLGDHGAPPRKQGQKQTGASFPKRPPDIGYAAAISASRTGSCGGLSPCRTSCARRRAGRGS